MSFDPFEARMQFLQLLRKLNASQLSIQKVVGYAIKYGSKCGEDLWECILEECHKGSLNTRINLLYLLDSLLEVSLPLSIVDAPYPPLISENLNEIIKGVVPGGEGVLNLRAAKQILESWRTRRLLDSEVVSESLKVLESQANQRFVPHALTSRPRLTSSVASGSGSGSGSKRGRESFSRGDIVRRMEEDRERHKRLRERIWILPIPPLITPSTTNSSSTTKVPLSRNIDPSPSSHSNSSKSPYTPASPAPAVGKPSAKSGKRPTSTNANTNTDMPPPPPPGTAPGPELGLGLGDIPDPLDVEFDQLWEMGSDLDPDDLDRMKEWVMIVATLFPFQW